MNFKKIVCTLLTTTILTGISVISVNATENSYNDSAYSEQEIIDALAETRPSDEEIQSIKESKRKISSETDMQKGETEANKNSNEIIMTTRSLSSSWAERKGNILVSMSAKTYGFEHGHTAIISDDIGKVLEALPGDENGVCNHMATKYWSTVDDEDELYAKGASWSQYDTAIQYAKNQFHEPYKIQTSLDDETSWYCSKLVYKAFEAAGVTVNDTYHYMPGVPGLKMVLPTNILWYENNIWVGDNTIQ